MTPSPKRTKKDNSKCLFVYRFFGQTALFISRHECFTVKFITCNLVRKNVRLSLKPNVVFLYTLFLVCNTFVLSSRLISELSLVKLAFCFSWSYCRRCSGCLCRSCSDYYNCCDASQKETLPQRL